MKSLTQRAEDFARNAHVGQLRKDRRTPYTAHLERIVARLAGSGESVIATAWLHDVLEDTYTTREELAEFGIPERVVDAVIALTKRVGEHYDEYLSRVAFDAIARKVKIMDIIDNLADTPSPAQIARYARGLNFLVNQAKVSIPE